MKPWILLLIFIGNAASEPLSLYLESGDELFLTEDPEDERATNGFFGYVPGDQLFWVLSGIENETLGPETFTWTGNFSSLDVLPTGTFEEGGTLNLTLTPLSLSGVPVPTLMSVNVSWELFFDNVTVASGDREIEDVMVTELKYQEWPVNVTGKVPETMMLSISVSGAAVYFAMDGGADSRVDLTYVPPAPPTETESASTSTSSTTSSSATSSSTSSSSSTPRPTSSSSSSSTIMEPSSTAPDTTSDPALPENKESPLSILIVIVALVLAVRQRLN